MSFFTDLAHQFIDGQWRTGSGSWDIIDFDPYNGEKLAAITVATVDEVDEAYRAAERAQRHWADDQSVHPPAGLRARPAHRPRSARPRSSRRSITELGGTRLKAVYEVHLAKEFLREAIQLALRPEGRILPSPVDGKENRVYRLPVGVIGCDQPVQLPLPASPSSRSPRPWRSATPSSSSRTRTRRSSAAA